MVLLRDDNFQPGISRGLALEMFLTIRFFLFRVKAVTKEDLVRVAAQYLVDPECSGRALIGPAQTGLEDLGWTTKKN